MTEKPKKPVGRPTKYRPEFAEQARKLCLLLNATDEDLAKFFEVNVDSVYEWKKVFPEFSEAIRAGKTVADAEVAAKLYDRATGAEWFEEEAVKVKTAQFDDTGRKVLETEKVEVVKVRRSAPPDTMAISFWLRNRRADKWRAMPDPSDDPDAVLPVKVDIVVQDATKPATDANA